MTIDADEQENKKPDIEIEKSSAVEVDIPGKSKPEEKAEEKVEEKRAKERVKKGR